MLSRVFSFSASSSSRLPPRTRLSSSTARLYTSSSRTSSRTSFTRPGPPPLPPAEQAEFDSLLKSHQTVGATPAATAPSAELEQHKDLRRGPRKDFEGDVNPQTGEVGGPKTDPFKAGDADWQYGGRVTDF